MRLTIVAVQSKVTQHWGYGPEHALHLLHLEYDDKPSGYLTAADALAAARKDRSIPKGARFEVRP